MIDREIARDGKASLRMSRDAATRATEGFLLMMRARPQVRIVGEPSRGASGNPGPFELLPGVTVFASRWRTLTPDGKLLERVGVEPHVRVDVPADADPVLDRALELLRR